MGKGGIVESYIWKDFDDPNMFHIGVLCQHWKTKEPYYSIWTSFPIDSLEELFGKDETEFIKNASKGVKHKVRLSIVQI